VIRFLGVSPSGGNWPSLRWRAHMGTSVVEVAPGDTGSTVMKLYHLAELLGLVMKNAWDTEHSGSRMGAPTV